jgi:hypothetical protein
MDEQSFQSLLSAAFTIQEHNARRKLELVQTEPAKEPQTEQGVVCQRCGAEKAGEKSRCEACGLDEFRPGERMQRNWASMWLMSQEQGLWPERATDPNLSASNFLATPMARQIEAEREMMAPDAEATRRVEQPDGETPLPASIKPWKSKTLSAVASGDSIREDFIAEGRDHQGLASKLPTRETQTEDDSWKKSSTRDSKKNDLLTIVESFPVEPVTYEEGSADAPLEAGAADHAIPVPSLSDSRLAELNWSKASALLRLHRADLYLGTAIFVAVLALLWPSASPPKRPGLDMLDRALISIGVAEGPAPVAHLPGDPGVEVWIDPHTALYYCQGDDLYGKAANGRFSTQREAQMDRFEPASRTACE